MCFHSLSIHFYFIFFLSLSTFFIISHIIFIIFSHFFSLHVSPSTWNCIWYDIDHFNGDMFMLINPCSIPCLSRTLVTIFVLFLFPFGYFLARPSEQKGDGPQNPLTRVLIKLSHMIVVCAHSNF